MFVKVKNHARMAVAVQYQMNQNQVIFASVIQATAVNLFFNKRIKNLLFIFYLLGDTCETFSGNQYGFSSLLLGRGHKDIENIIRLRKDSEKEPYEYDLLF
jgi:hypothetical protein